MPHTASTAISQELCQYYDGISILHKHAHYYEFIQELGDKADRYFTFAGVRNPLDVAATLFYKKKTNHQGFFTDPVHWRINGGHISRAELKKYHYIQDQNASYPRYFRKYYKFSYDSWGSPSPDDFDFVIRYEQLQQDFSQILLQLNLDQVRPLPVVNKTGEKKVDFWTYYSSEIKQHTIQVFGPYMQLWEYSFPDSWGNITISSWHVQQFRILRFLRKQVLWNDSLFARVFNKFWNQLR